MNFNILEPFLFVGFATLVTILWEAARAFGGRPEKTASNILWAITGRSFLGAIVYYGSQVMWSYLYSG